MRQAIRIIILPIVLSLSGVAHATDWSTQDYDLHLGDFNGDSRDDVLYIAKAADKGSGIVLADQSGNLTLSHQVWASNHLNIPWYGNVYRAIVADFNGDSRDDILLQKQSPGDHYLLLANTDGKFLGISQSIANTTMALAWSADQHVIVAGDFDGNGRADLFLQGKAPSATHAIVMPDANGQFTGSSAYQTWSDGYLGFQWSWGKALIFAGNFNGDARTDLFVQAKPDILIIDYDIPFPVPRYRPNSYGIVLALDPAGGVVFRSGSVNQYWSRNYLGLDWSPNASNVVIGDFNDDGKDDIFVQSRQSGRQNAILFATTSAQFQSTGSISDTSILNSWTGDNYRVLAGAFNADGRRGLYAQTVSANGTNYVAQDITIQSAATVHDPSSVVPVTPGTAVGAIPGEFSVDPSGGAGYAVPIAAPPGVAGVDPELAIAYSSRSGNGLLGIGWSITGLSVISRCPSTVAQDTSADGVDFDSSDRFCLDGGRLIVIGGAAYGAVGAEYRTELESFQKVVSSGGTAGDPNSFTVWDKSGLVREYGATSDSRIEAQGRTEATVWAVKRIRDRFNNLIEFNYAEETSNGSFRPTSVRYGNSTSGTTINTEVGKIEFTYETRSDVESGYLVGSVTGQTHRLKKISVWARPDQAATTASAKVREYYLVYEYSPTSNLTHLKQLIQCDGGSGSGQKCLGATEFQWQHGYRGFSESISTNATLGSIVDLKMFDVNNDGRTDYVYKKNGRWYFKVLGMQGTEFDSSRTAVASDYAIAMDYDSDGFGDLLQKSASPGTTLQVLRGSDAGLSAPASTTAPNAALSQYSLKTTVGDADADGRQDLIYGDTWGQIITYRGSASGFATPVSSSINVADSPVSEGSVHAIQTSTPGASLPALSVVNYNGDGLDDLLVRVKLCTHFSGELCGGYFTQWQLMAANGNGTFTVVWRKTTDLLKLKITDGNGDGLTDLLFFDSATAKWVLWVNHGALISGNPLGPFTQDWSSSSVTYVQREDVNWAYFQQLIYGQPSASPVTVSLTEDLLRQAQIFDYNRDGRADVLIPVSGTWRVQQSTGSGYDGLLLDTGRTASFADRTMVLDNLSDGLSDLMYPDGTTSGSTFRIYYQRGPVAAGLIDKITDGFGATTQIQYSTLNEYESNGVNPIAYKGRTDLVETGGPPSFPIVHFAAPIPVVHKFTADNGRLGNGAVLTTYEYRGMKVHRQGRGMLGFSEVRSWNDNSAIQTINKYAQTEPYTGMVLQAEQKFPDQTLYNTQLPGDAAPNLRLQYQSSCDSGPLYCPAISAPPVTHVTGNTVTKTTNILRSRLLPHGSKLPFLGKSTELVYPLMQSGSQPAAFKRTVTDYLDIGGGETVNAYDDDGNAIRIRVTVDHAGNPAANPSDISVVDTFNYYDAPDYGNWCLGRVNRTTVAHTRPNYSNGNQADLSQTRESTFEYFPNTSNFRCLLSKENTEPNAAGGTLRLTKEYAYDTFGSRTTETINGPDITTRSATTAYDSQGQFAATVSNALGHQEVQQWNTRFGVQTQLTGPNGLITTWQHDTFGRKTLETPPSPNLALYTQTSFHWCPGYCTDSRAVYAVKTASSDGSYVWVEFDRLGREMRTRKLGFDGREVLVDRFYDPLGREYLVSAPYYAGNTQCWTFRKFDQLGRVFDEWSASSQSECVSGAYAFDAALPAGGRRNQYQYDELNTQGIVTTVVTNAGDATARTVTKTANPMGRVRFVKDVIDASTTYVTEYDYDPAGNNSWVRDNAGNQTRLAYNVRSFKTQMVDPDMGTWTYVYDVLGQLKQQTDAKNQVTTLDYDLLGRVKIRTEKLTGGATETTSQWFYDENSASQPSKGKLTRVTGANAFEEHYTYDAFGRLDNTRRKVDGGWYWISTTYDNLNRVDTIKYPNSVSSSSDTSAGPDADRFRVKQNYSTRGYRESVQEIQPSGALGTVYWRATSVDDLGNVTTESLGNGLLTSRTIDRASGFLKKITTGATIVTDVQNLDFDWDKAGNLAERIDYKINGGAGIKEQFTYDKLYRVKDLKFFASSAASSPTATETMSYDTIGNITGKGTQYTGYNYTTATGCTNPHAQPHAVRRFTANGVQRTYCYDPNGNVYSASGSNVTYTGVTWYVGNLAKRITRSTNEWAEFSYDPNRARYKQVAQLNASTSETTLYVGSIYEKRTQGANVEHVHYIRDGNDTVAVFKRKSGGVLQTRYLHRDHLGSVVATTTDTGAVEERFSFDPWGKRRDGLTVNNTVGANHWTGPSAGSFMTLASSFTHRGYTGHEHIDHIGLVNMNGRVYDPEIGRFLSADPTVQFPLSTQGLNRYTYTGNNPLSYFDPSGFSWRRVMQVVGIVLSFIPGWGQALGAFWKGVIVGFLSSGGDAKMAALGGIGGALFNGIGGLENLHDFQRAFLHGLAGGALNLAAGARFGEGFLGAFGGSFASARLGRSNSFKELAGVPGDGDALGMIKRTAVAAVVGGTVSRVGGGKFENGAVTAAFGHLFNDEQHRGRSTPETRRANVDAAVAYARREGLVGEFTYDYVDEYVRLERRADGKEVVVRCKDAWCDGRGGAGALTNTDTGHVTFFRASAEVPVGVVHWVDPVTPKVASTMDRHVYAFTDIRSGFEHALFVTAHEYWHVRTGLGGGGDPTLQHLEWRANAAGVDAVRHYRNH